MGCFSYELRKCKMKKQVSPLILILFFSCGNNENDAAQFPQQIDHGHSQHHHEEIYRSVLHTINPQIKSNKASGTAEIKISDDEIDLRVTMIDAPEKIRHLQYIASGPDCPTLDADLNGDGFIDLPEVIANDGKIFIPLNKNLDFLTSELRNFPLANHEGYYNYLKNNSFHLLTEDLNEGINLEDRHLIVLGVSKRINLPESIGEISELSKEASLPIACGKMHKIIEE
jgi:hypothetical protein